MQTALGYHYIAPDWTPAEQAKWHNFTPDELACKCATSPPHFCKGEYWHSPAFLDAMQRLRDDIGLPLRFTSARRCKGRNKAVGGASLSQHLIIAADISLVGHDRVRLARAALKAGFRGIGFGRTFLHVDMGPKRAWNYQVLAAGAWRKAFGYDPVARFKATGRF